MSQADPELMAFVERQMTESPAVSSKDLFEKAKEAFASARELNIREFHARYPLQVKRKASLASGSSRRRRRKSAANRRKAAAREAVANRDAVRSALLKFASDLSAAEERKDLVQVLAKVDDYVDAVLKAAAS